MQKMKIRLIGILSIAILLSVACEEKSKTVQGVIKTGQGDMTFELYDDTPGHRDNFVKLASEGFYDDLLFHRVVPQFMIQGGDPNSKGAPAGKGLGAGGPGYTIPNEIMDKHCHFKGAIAAARTGNPERRSSGSQFYIVTGRTVSDAMLDGQEKRFNFKYTPEQRARYKSEGGYPGLDMDYTVYGQLLTGIDVAEKIAALQKDTRNRPTQDVKMKIVLK